MAVAKVLSTRFIMSAGLDIGVIGKVIAMDGILGTVAMVLSTGVAWILVTVAGVLTVLHVPCKL